MMLKMKNLL